MPELILVSCKYFMPLIHYIKTYFEKQDISCNIVDTINPYEQKTHLIFDIRDRDYIPLNFIVYNFEQLEASNLSEIFYEKISLAKCIFDYSERNVEFLQNRCNISAFFMPYSWFPNLRNVQEYLRMKDRICSFMFVGYFNNRRRNILKLVHQNATKNNQKMFLSSDAWKENYANKARITRISLNIHCYSENTILEIHRIIPCILDKNIVLTEKSNDPYYDNLLDNCVTWITEDDIVEKINTTLNIDSDELDNIVNNRLRTMINKMRKFDKIIDEYKSNILEFLT